mmetsp:Transcript_20684/g.34102  ORF Transcript_20684/g.34102 Transcript_20684/m.34102 type:complete len:115 (+) Transcript_20684:313-657(+)
MQTLLQPCSQSQTVPACASNNYYYRNTKKNRMKLLHFLLISFIASGAASKSGKSTETPTMYPTTSKSSKSGRRGLDSSSSKSGKSTETPTMYPTTSKSSKASASSSAKSSKSVR